MKKLMVKFKSLPAKPKLLITFLFNCVFWLFAEFIKVLILPKDEPLYWKETLFYTVFMGTFWTFFFSWKLVKQCFGKNGKR